MISFRHRLWLGIALAHLFLVTLGASYFDLAHLGPLETPLRFYGALSGAGNSYGFFAPGIYDQLRARFAVSDTRGKLRYLSLETGASKEADLRMGNIIDQFAPDGRDEEESRTLQRSLSASLARVFFIRDRTARQVTVTLEDFHPVSMGEYRKGQRPYWQTLYTARYSLPAKVANE